MRFAWVLLLALALALSSHLEIADAHVGWHRNTYCWGGQVWYYNWFASHWSPSTGHILLTTYNLPHYTTFGQPCNW